MCAGAVLPQLQGAAAADQAAVWQFSNTSTAHLGGSPDTLLTGTQWTGADAGGRVAITYSFANAASVYSGEESDFRATLREFSVEDKALTRAALAGIEAVCNVRFVEVADSGAQCGQVRYAYSQAPSGMGYAGFAYYPSGSEVGGDVWIATAQSTPEWAFYRPNLILHETLHAIGLKHPFEGGATLGGALNIIPNTVMSYSPIEGARTGWLSSYPSTPMPLDVQALQALYGAAPRNAGDTVYDLADAAYQSGFATLWDTGGRDMLDAGRVGGGVSLDLRAQTRSDVGAEVRATGYIGNSSTATSGSYSATLAIAAGVRIEDATGSAHADILIGNDGANVLWGGAGNDKLEGMAGDDRLFGGAGDDLIFITAGGTKMVDGGSGTDRVMFSGARGDYTVSEWADRIVVTRADGGGSSTLYGIERIEFSDAALAIAGAQTPQAQLLSGLQGQAFRLYNAAFDRLPDAGGLAYHTHALQAGASLVEVAAGFVASPEFAALYGAPDDAGFVTQLYRNVLDREPDAPGLAYHLARLEEGASWQEVLVGFSESAENQVAVVGIAQSAAALLPL